MPFQGPVRESERRRRASVFASGLLDTAPDECFERVARMAARLLGVPISLISLMDDRRQWFKGRVGLEVQQLPLNDSICIHAIEGPGPLIIPDARLDPRFNANPLVVGDPGIRAYVGYPILGPDGERVGALCAIDTKPRHFSDDEVNALGDLARMVDDLLLDRTRRAQDAAVLDQMSKKAAAAEDRIAIAGVGLLRTSLAGALVHANQRALDILGWMGRYFKRFIHRHHPSRRLGQEC